jgi:lipopolysaccharide biosynthesis glycosyltransferase
MSRAKSGGRKDDKNLVVGAIDDNMVYPVLVWAFSLHRGAATAPHIIIGFLTGHLSERNRRIVGRALTYLGISHEFLELASDTRFIAQGHISPTTFTKFLLADQITELNVWIDVDTVATEGLDSIFDSIAQSPEEVKLVVAERGNGGSRNLEEVVKPSDLVFNAGVLGWPARPRLPWSDQLDNFDIVETQEQFLFNSLYASHIAQIPETYNKLTYRRDHFRDTAPPFILHYAGAHKPWHMPRRFSLVCTSYRCPWSLWFDAEKDMLDAVARSPLVNEVEGLKNHALTSGAIGKSRDYSGRKLLRTLQRMGIMGWVLVFAAKPFSRWIPRGTHPLH